jgi:hypothetical protein
MPQLDKINWFLIIFVLVLLVSVLLIFFIKFIFYSWKKTLLLKTFNIFSTLTNVQKNKFIPFLFLLANFLQLRKHLFESFFLIKQNLIFPIIKDVEKKFLNK